MQTDGKIRVHSGSRDRQLRHVLPRSLGRGAVHYAGILIRRIA